MSYVTQQQLSDRYGDKMLRDLSDRGQPPLGVADATVIARALADTDAMIDGYLQGRYVLPLAAVPALLTDLAAQVAIYKLHRSIVADKVRRDYDDALRQLRDIAAGTIRLSVAGVEPEGNTAGGVTTNSPERIFTSGPMTGLI